jgi:ergothioneine biosynthesis protein EgtB
MVVQSMPDASPAKWHLAHTSWFFETFLLRPLVPGYRPLNPEYGYLFNSYYESLGPRQPRPKRGLLTRPPIAGVLAYRRHVDAHMNSLLASDLQQGPMDLLELGLAHEEQHQELMLIDILHLFSQSPGLPAYDHQWPTGAGGPQGKFRHHAGGLTEIGFHGSGLAFDNEMPRHQVWLQPFEISDRLVTNGE